MDLGLALLCKQLLLYYTLKSMYALQICYIHMKNHQFLWGKYKMENGNPMIFTGKSCLQLFPHKGYWIFASMYSVSLLCLQISSIKIMGFPITFTTFPHEN